MKVCRANDERGALNSSKITNEWHKTHKTRAKKGAKLVSSVAVLPLGKLGSCLGWRAKEGAIMTKEER